MSAEFGIMQGRLTPKYEGRYQSHPAGYWQSEFYLAAELGLSLIEFIVDEWTFAENPLLNKEGREEIARLSAHSGVGVKTLCADIFMDWQFVGNITSKASEFAVELLSYAKELGIRDIVVPCVDRSSMAGNVSTQKAFCDAIRPICEKAEEMGLRINLETDLGPAEFSEILERIGRELVWVNYDMGNSAALGFDPRDEFAAYQDRISNIHIKDRRLHGASVPLGAGNADFECTINELHSCQFGGPIIFQAARQDNFVQDLLGVQQQMLWFWERW